MFKKVIYFTCLSVLLLLTACSSNQAIKDMSVEEAMKKANDFFSREKYNKAIPYYEKIVNESSSILMADAQMKLADSYFYSKKYIDARFEYEEFIRQFSDDREVAKAFFQIGVCWYEQSMPAHYDQEETYSAIDAFEEFIERFPFDDRKTEAIEYINKCRYKLLEKKYYNGYVYYKISDYPSALLYFSEIIELDNLNELDKNARYYSILMYIERKDLKSAQDMAEDFFTRYEDSKEADKIHKEIEKLKEKLAEEDQ